MTLIQEKIAQAKVLVKELGVDCWITFVRETALNGDPILQFLVESNLTWHSAIFVTARGEAVALVGSLDAAAVQDLHAYDRVESYVKSFKEPFLGLLREFKARTIAINYSTGSEVCDGLTHGMYLTLHALVAESGIDVRMVSAERLISALRQRKTRREIAAMKEAIRITLEIYDAVGRVLKPGMTEQEIAAFMKARVAEAGVGFAWDAATCPAVFTGPDTAGAHYGPTARKVERGHVLNMDFGLKVDGYCSDLQRTFYIRREGETTAPGSVQHGFETIRRSIEAARQAMRPGVRGIDVDAASRAAVTGGGFQEFPHAVGHQVGRFAHDGTALLGPAWEKYAHKPFEALEEGMVFTIEPRLLVPGHGTVTIEEMVIVTADGAEYLSAPQEELYLI